MSISLSETAASRVRRFLASSPQGVGLRFGVRKTGCSGFAYVVDVAEQVNDDDTVYEAAGIKVLIDAKSLPMVDGTHIGYERQGLNEGFAYDNPNVRNQCGCGESFGV